MPHKDPERRRAYYREYYATRLSQFLAKQAYDANWYQQNKGRVTELHKAWKKENADRNRELNRLSRARHPDKARANHLQRVLLFQFFVRAAKSEGCIDCGEKDLDVLDFDHVAGTKKGIVSWMKHKSLAAIVAEIGKCEIRCANCHRRVTKRRRVNLSAS